MFTVNIDAGGTMTDALILGDGKTLMFKVDSTPHDLTVALMNLLNDAAESLGYTGVAAFLSDVAVIRWSSTVTSNALAEQRGPKVGLLVDVGEEEKLYGEGRSPALDSILDPNNVVSIAQDDDQEQTLISSIRGLLEAGVRRVCVSFAGAFADPEAEKRIRQLVQKQYPDHYMGAVPVLLGHEMAQTPDDMTRTHSALINAYVHPALATSLFKAEDRLKYEHEWSGNLLVGHTNGGMARIGKTKAIDTIESGPIFGTYAGAYFARQYEVDTVLCLDVGGTTAKCSVARDGKPAHQQGGNLFGIPLATSMQLLRSTAMGGGSVVRPEPDAVTNVRIGPESMGCSPGPACYGLGGEQATVTDCFVVLGYIDPIGFQSGRRELDVGRAREAVERHLAKPLKVSVEKAALLARDCAAEMVSGLVDRTAVEAGIDAIDSQMYAYGGNGPLFATFVADILGISRVNVSFSLAPIFSAFGTAISDITHVYEHAIQTDQQDSGTAIEEILDLLRSKAHRDLEAEGYDVNMAEYHAELEIDGAETIPLGPDVELTGISSVLLRLRAEYGLGSYEPARLTKGNTSCEHAVSDYRNVWFTEDATEVPIVDFTKLQASNTVRGPAIVSGESLTCLIAAGWTMTVDEYGMGVLSRIDA